MGALISEADVCIVGAGPAGLAVAAGLVEAGRSVTLVEAGDTNWDGTTLPRVRIDAEDPYPFGAIDQSHAAMVGGSTGLWAFQLVAEGDAEPASTSGGRYVPLEPLDYLARPEIGTPGWPIGGTDLEPFYMAAQQLCGIGPFRYDTEHWADAEAQPLPLEGTGVVTSMFQFGAASAYTLTLPTRLKASGQVRLLRNTSAVRLEYAAGSEGRIDGVWVAGADGAGLLRASSVVLAAGGLETVRLLLDTGRATGRTPGNHSGLVGRYFMEHPLVRGGLLVTDQRDAVIRRLGLYATRKVRGTYVSAKLTLTEDVVAAEGLLACSALLVPRDAAYGSRSSQALSRLRSPSGRRDPLPTRLLAAARVVAGAPSVARAVLAQHRQPTIDLADWTGANADPRFSVFELLHQTEQSPDPDNRLTLAPERDALGRSGLALNWRWSLADQERIARSRDLFAAALAGRGIGTVVNTDWDDGRPRFLGGTHHHIGVTRMSRDPDRGVVDSDCRVHGTDNLFVAGTAVFPSSGFVNPTLTVVALGLRLGAHLGSSVVSAIHAP